MAIINCRKCHKVFEAFSGFSSVCPQCIVKEEEDFKRVKSFVWDHPGVTVDEVSQICDVSPHDVREWLREERLSLKEGVAAGLLTCDICGKPILAGRLCEKCREKARSEMAPSHEKVQMKGSYVASPETEEASKMRFLDSVNKKNQT